MWFRIIMMLVMIKGDNIEGALSNIGYVLLSSQLNAAFQLVQGKIMLPKLVRLQKVHPEVLRKFKFPMKKMIWHILVSSFVAYLLVISGSKRLTSFLLITTGLFPIFRCFVFPKMWPIPMFMFMTMYLVWRYEGVQELFVGLLFFQAVPVLQEVVSFYVKPILGQRVANFAVVSVWVFSFLLCVPIISLVFFAFLDPRQIDRFIRRRTKKENDWYWRKFEKFQGVLGFVDESGENPFQILGVSQSATLLQIRKRFRDLSVKYHPDKTNNDPVKSEYFVKLQRAMEAITSGTADGKVNENALQERVSGTIHRCVELMPIIAMWLALSIWGTFMQYMQTRSKKKKKVKKDKKKKKTEKTKKKKKIVSGSDSVVVDDVTKDIVIDDADEHKAAKAESEEEEDDYSEDDEEFEDDDVDDDSSAEDEEEENLPNVGPSFVGAQMLNNIYGGQRRAVSKARSSAGVTASEPTRVGGRRIQTPMPSTMPTNHFRFDAADEQRKKDDQ
jgi:hypothetical protein